MKRTNTKQFKAGFDAVMVPIIKGYAENYGATVTGNPYKFVIDTARREVPHEFERGGNQKGLEYWLSGCGLLGLPVYYGEIVETAEKMHGEKLTDKQAETVIENWFRFVACKICQYARATR